MALLRASAASAWRWSSSSVLPYSLFIDHESAATDRSSSDTRSAATARAACCETSESSGCKRIPAIEERERGMKRERVLGRKNECVMREFYWKRSLVVVVGFLSNL